MEAFTHRINISGKQARYYNLSQLNSSIQSNAASRVPAAHFYGGNSFTVGTYKPLLQALSTNFDISSLALRGYWYDKPQRRRLTREQDAEMLIEFLEKTQNKPVVGIGHSQGATATAIATAMRPDIFFTVIFNRACDIYQKTSSGLYNLLPRKVLLNREPLKAH